MSGFNELVKSFPKTREYVRDFFVYGFKTREDFKKKSTRTYDNERRRLESWLAEYIQQDNTVNGKSISLAIDNNLLDSNPLHRVWKTKSFTNNDIMLHFFILDYLSNTEGVTAEEVTDGIINRYQECFDVQAVRRKCNAYVKEGLLRREKTAKDLRYYKGDNFSTTLEKTPMLLEALKLYQLTEPFGIVGNTILDNLDETNNRFRIKHSFCAFTLEDEILLTILQAMHNHSHIDCEVHSSKTGQMTHISGVPMQIFASTKTGRRFLCMYRLNKQQFTSLRLDTIKQVTENEKVDNYDDLRKTLEEKKKHLWGVTFVNDTAQQLETVTITMHINEDTEDYILERLRREGKHGVITKLSSDTFSFKIHVCNSQEMLPWLRSFTCRIIDIKSTSGKLEAQFYKDLQTQYHMYNIK